MKLQKTNVVEGVSACNRTQEVVPQFESTVIENTDVIDKSCFFHTMEKNKSNVMPNFTDKSREPLS